MSAPGSDFVKREILVVDDTPDNHLLIDQTLPAEMYRLHHASSADEALKTLRENAGICLMLVDVQMPDCDGFEFAKRYYGAFHESDIPIIFLSAYKTRERDLFQGHKLGAYDYLVRPFYPPLLQEKVRNLSELYLSKKYLKEHVTILAENNRILSDLKDQTIRSMSESAVQKSELLHSKIILEQQVEALQLQLNTLQFQLKGMHK